MAERNEQQALINRQLQQIDQVFKSGNTTTSVKHHTRSVRTLLEAMVLRLEPAQAPATALMQRQIRLKEAQLRLLLARQTLSCRAIYRI